MSTARADRVFAKLQNELGLSPDGKAWLTAVLDPFHDEAIPNLNGLPDGSNSRSCVQIVRSSKQISCPASVTSGTWDCHVVSYPFFGAQALYASELTLTPGFWAVGANGDDLNYAVAKLGSPTLGLGGVVAYSNATSTAKCGPDSTAGTVAQNLNNSFMKGSYRIIAKAYEIMATGPDLYQSGSVASYRLPVPSTQDSVPVLTQVVDGAIGTVIGSASPPTKVYDMIPETYSEINLIPDTKTWKAKQGVYIVDNMNAESFDSYSTIDSAIAYVDRSISIPGDSSTTWNNAWIANIGQNELTPPTMGAPVTYPLVVTAGVSNFHHSGAYFTGLNLQDTLTINCIWYVERFPSTKESDLIVLARPTPLRDDIALKIYSHCLESMPVAMPFDSNFLGGWFDDIVSTVSDFVSPVASAIGDVLPGGLGMLAKGIGVLTKKEKKKIAVNEAPAHVSTIRPSPPPAPRPKVPVKALAPPRIPVRQRAMNPAFGVAKVVPKTSKRTYQ